MNFTHTHFSVAWRRFLGVFALILAFGASSLCSSIALQSAWQEFMVDARPLLIRGIEPRKIMEDAFMLHEQEVLTVRSTKIFIELFDALLIKVSQTASFESAEVVKAFRNHLFSNILSNFVLQQKLALEVFRQHKKWNVTMTDTGLVGSVDTSVFMNFVQSLKQTFSDLTSGGARFCTIEDLEVLYHLIDELSTKFRPNFAVVALKDAGSFVGHGFKGAVQFAGKTTSSFYSRGVRAINAIDAQSIKRGIMTVGAVSAIALLVGACYTINNRKRLARDLFDVAGGIGEVKKKAIALYTLPESRLERVLGWFRDWSYDDAGFRKAKAADLKQCLDSSLSCGASVADVREDPLTAQLLEIARQPESVKPECVDTVLKEMSQDMRYREFDAKKRKAFAATEAARRAEFRKAADAYLSSVTGVTVLDGEPQTGSRLGRACLSMRRTVTTAFRKLKLAHGVEASEPFRGQVVHQPTAPPAFDESMVVMGIPLGPDAKKFS